MNKLLETLIAEKRSFVTKEELADYLDLTVEDIERTIIKIKSFMNIDLKNDDKIDRNDIYYLSTKLPWTADNRHRNRKRLLELSERLKYIEKGYYNTKYREEFKMKILEKIKEEKRTYVIDFELAVLLDLDFGDVRSIVEKVADQIACLNIDGYPRPEFRKEDGKYLLDRDCVIFLLPDFGDKNYSNRCKMIELIRLLYLNQLEKNI